MEGVTEFIPGQKPRVRITAALATSENRENRYRTTLTHEYGHVRLHGYLFALTSDMKDLFAPKQESEVIACKRDTMISASQTDWLEWQAGYACGAILMPACHARTVASVYTNRSNLYGPVPPASEHGRALIDAIVDVFQVSRDAARVRLSVLGILGEAGAARSLFD